MKAKLRLLASLWWLFVAAGVLELGGGLAAAHHDAARGRYGAVLRHPSAIAAAADRLYVYTDWGRIRVFGLDGAEQASWPLATGNGAVTMVFDSASILHVAAIRTDTYYRFDRSGHLLGEAVDVEAFHRFPIESFFRSQAPNGTLYQIVSRSVVATSPNGQRSVIVPGPPRALSFFSGSELSKNNK